MIPVALLVGSAAVQIGMATVAAEADTGTGWSSPTTILAVMGGLGALLSSVAAFILALRREPGAVRPAATRRRRKAKT